MLNSRLWCLLIPLLLCVSAFHADPVAGRQSRTAAPTRISFEVAVRHIIVKGRINNSRPLSFVLDTGANRAIVRMATAVELGLSLGDNVNTGGAGPGTQVGRRVRDARWSLAGLEGFSQPLTLALPMPELPSGLGRDIDGIVGGEVIREFVTELDYQTRSITLHDRKTFTYTGKGEALPLEFNSDGHPVVRAAVTPIGGEPIEHRFLLDIGSGLAIALHSPFVAEHGLAGPQSKTVRLIGGVGAGGRVNGRLGRLAAVRIGSFTIVNPVALFALDKAGAFADPSLAGNIGAQIASRFHIVLDYAGRRIILEPSPTFEEPFDRAFSGINLRAEGPDYHIFRVREVLEDSPATEAGIEEGDVITAIDGARAESLTLTAINEMLETAVPRQLTVRRGERTLRITLTPKNLV